MFQTVNDKVQILVPFISAEKTGFMISGKICTTQYMKKLQLDPLDIHGVQISHCFQDDHIVDFYLKALKIFLEATKGKVQAILIGDDVGSQRGLMISPALISEFVIPGAKKLIDLAHSYGVILRLLL